MIHESECPLSDGYPSDPINWFSTSGYWSSSKKLEDFFILKRTSKYYEDTSKFRYRYFYRLKRPIPRIIYFDGQSSKAIQQVVYELTREEDLNNPEAVNYICQSGYLGVTDTDLNDFSICGDPREYLELISYQNLSLPDDEEELKKCREKKKKEYPEIDTDFIEAIKNSLSNDWRKLY